jgi:hypothetical protein
MLVSTKKPIHSGAGHMFGITCVPSSVYSFLSRFKPLFTCAQGRHFIICCWIITGLLLETGSGCLKSILRYVPARISYWSALRFLRSTQWDEAVVVREAGTELLAELSPPADGILYLVGDPTLKGKRGLLHPLGKKTRINKFSPYIFAVETVIVVAAFGPYRIPVFAGVVDPAIPGHANKLFRQALREFKKPAWAKQVIVLGDAGTSATKTLQTIRQRGFDYVFAVPRSRKFTDGGSLRDLVTHLPKSRYRRCASYKPDGRRRDYWTYLKRSELKNLGHVTIVLSKPRRNDGPKSVKIIVTNLDSLGAGQICSVYARRWGVETTIKELKSGLHFGRMQVTKEPERVKRSLALSVLAYITVVWIYGRTPTTVRNFSLFHLKERFTQDVFREHNERTNSRWRRRLEKAKRAA